MRLGCGFLWVRRVHFGTASKGPFYIGLDVNTHSTGLVCLNSEEQVIHASLINTSADESLVSKGQTIHGALRALHAELQPDSKVHVGIENCLMNFAGGASSRQVQFKLAQLNAITQYVACEQYGSLCILVHPRSARSYLKSRFPDVAALTAPAKGAAKNEKKHAVWSCLKDMVPEHLFQWKMMPRSGRLADVNYDLTDALMIALCMRHQLLTTGGD